jgi:hypothetical protein
MTNRLPDLLRLLISTFVFFEADYLLQAMKKKRLTRFIIVCTAIWICFNIILFLPIIISGKNLILLFIVFLIIFFIVPFFLVLRIRLIGYSENALLRRIAPSSIEKQKLFSLIHEKISITLGVYTLLFLILFCYALLISLFFLVCGAISLFLFIVQLLVAAALSIISLLFMEFRCFSFAKKWKWVKPGITKLFGITGLPFIGAGITAILLFMIGFFYFPGWKPSLFISVTAAVFTSYPLLRRIFPDKRFYIAFRFTLLIFSILVIFLFFSPLEFTMIKGEHPCGILFYEIISPLAETLTSVFKSFHTILEAVPFPLVIILPLIFFPVLAFNRGIYEMAYLMRKHFEKRLQRKLFGKKTKLYFFSVLSPYHGIFSFIGIALIALILFHEITPVARLLYGLVVTFKIAQVFRLTFLTYEAIHQSVFILFTAIAVLILLRVTGRFLSSLRSYLCLSTDEFVFAENKIFSYTLLRIPLKKVTCTMIKQSPLERIVDTGTLFIESTEGSGMIRIKGVPFIRERHKLFMEKVKGVL